jgi:hypothetical protein
MCLAIIMKWLIHWTDTSKAPSIISIYINMGVMDPGTAFYGDEEGVLQSKIQ